MVMGQISEALFILAIPFLFNRIGVKKMLLIGMTAWILKRNRMRELKMLHRAFSRLLLMASACSLAPGSQALLQLIIPQVRYQWRSIWFIPAYIAVAVLICFIFFFREKQ